MFFKPQLSPQEAWALEFLDSEPKSFDDLSKVLLVEAVEDLRMTMDRLCELGYVAECGGENTGKYEITEAGRKRRTSLQKGPIWRRYWLPLLIAAAFVYTWLGTTVAIALFLRIGRWRDLPAWWPLALVLGLGVIVLCIVLVTVLSLFLYQAVRYFLRPAAERRRLLELWEAAERNRGIDVELDGRRVAVLTDGRDCEGPWQAFYIEPLTDDPVERERMLTDPAWWQQDLKFRDPTYKALLGCFPGTSPLDEEGRVWLRGGGFLSDVELPNMFERYMLRRRMKTGRAGAPDRRID